MAGASCAATATATAVAATAAGGVGGDVGAVELTAVRAWRVRRGLGRWKCG